VKAGRREDNFTCCLVLRWRLSIIFDGYSWL
jgi:hypothetical protein